MSNHFESSAETLDLKEQHCMYKKEKHLRNTCCSRGAVFQTWVA